MSVASSEPQMEETEHALLVPLGQFAQAIGLIEALRRVPFPMKTVQHRPGDKLATVLIHILAGGMHLNELATAAHPLVADLAVAHAWDQDHFASSSGISATIAAATDAVVTALKRELEAVMAPDRAAQLAALSPDWLVVDVDLTGLVVSDQARTYEDATWGYMGELGRVGKGYQFARAQVAGPHERILLGGFLHPGNVASLACMSQLVALVEARLGRPRRRTELVERRLAATQEQLAQVEARLARLQPAQTGERLRPRRDRLDDQVSRLQVRLSELATDNQTADGHRRIILRLDGAFGSADNLTWLIEQGYSVVARGHNQQVSARLRKEEGLVWQRLSQNTEIAESRCTQVGDSPYSLRLFLCRQAENRFRRERWSTIIVSPDLAAPAWHVRRVGEFYNARQDTEAGIKEGKQIFASRHLPTRSKAGIEVYQELVLLAQNLWRCFRRQVLARTALGRDSIKTLVHSAARTRAMVSRTGHQLVLCFASGSRWAGMTLALVPQATYQLWFPFLEAAREQGP
jgi:hypothetical protein